MFAKYFKLLIIIIYSIFLVIFSSLKQILNKNKIYKFENIMEVHKLRTLFLRVFYVVIYN